MAYQKQQAIVEATVAHAVILTFPFEKSNSDCYIFFMNEKMNIRKIAELAACAPSTVSRVLSGNYGSVRVGEETKRRILDVCRRENYTPDINAKRLFTKRTGVFGLLVPPGMGQDSSILNRFINSIYAELGKNALRLLLLVADERFFKEGQSLSLFKRREIDALIIWGMQSQRASEIKELLDQENTVAILSANRLNGAPCVCADDRKGIFELTKHCQKRGASKFLYIGGPEDSDVSLRRKSGFMDAVGKNKSKLLPGDFSIKAGQHAAKSIASYKPDAVICVNDLTALGVIKGLKKKNIRIPKDIMLTGAGNILLSEHVEPALTTFSSREDLQGKLCVKQLISFLKNKKPLKSETVPPQIIIRDSA